MITIERIGIDSGIALNTVSNMEISIKPNQHTKMILSGVLDESVDSIHADWQGTNIRVLELDHNTQPKDTLFNGIIETTYIYAENGVSQIIITALSASIMMDKKEHSRSYQDIEETYGALVRQTVQNMGGSVKIFHPDTSKIYKPVFQYMETDWEFCKRMASHMGMPLYSEPSAQGIALQVGIDTGKVPVMEIGQEYQAVIKPQTLNSQMSMSYEIKSYENYRLGDLVKSPSGDMYISQKAAVFEKGELHFAYTLCYLKDIHVDVLYNAKIAGMLLEGEVMSTKGENVFVRFDIDGVTGDALYPFPWTPVTGNIMYCMPEPGTKVGVYFGSSDESGACAIINFWKQEKYVNSAQRTLETKYGRLLKLYPEQLSMQMAPLPTKTLALELIDKKRVNLQSHKFLSIYSQGNIMLRAPYITIQTPTELHVSRTALRDMNNALHSRNPATGGGAVDSIFTMGQEFNLLSEQGVLCGTEYIHYEDCDDDLTEITIEVTKSFNGWQLAGCVLAGLAFVAVATLVAAYAASVVFSGGVMAAAAPWVVGACAALIGSAAVLAKAKSDYNNQTNSSVWDYVGAALLGATAGAVAGFAIVGAPATAQFLTQQAILMIPSNPFTLNLVSGAATLITGGFTFSNLIFTRYNVVEAVSGENPLKDWMKSIDAKNGERDYYILSSVSFIAAMGIMFTGYSYPSALCQVGDTEEGFALVRSGKPFQWHHFFTDKNKVYTPKFENILQKYGLSLNARWNMRLLPHIGKHTIKYHKFMLNKLIEFDNIAQGDVKIFLELFEELKNYITKHPDILYLK